MVGQGSTVSNFGNQGPMAQNGGEVIMTPGESNATIQEDKLMKRWPMRVYLQDAEYGGSYRYLEDIKLARCQALIPTTIVRLLVLYDLSISHKSGSYNCMNTYQLSLLYLTTR
jgi:hypothetical protein